MHVDRLHHVGILSPDGKSGDGTDAELYGGGDGDCACGGIGELVFMGSAVVYRAVSESLQDLYCAIRFLSGADG